VKCGLQARKADNLTAICEPTVWKMWEPSRPVTAIALPFLYSVLQTSPIEDVCIVRLIKLSHRICHGSRASVVDIATGYGLDDTGVGIRVPVGSRILSFPRCPGLLCGPPSHLTNGTGCSFPGANRPGAWSWPYISNQWRSQENLIYASTHHTPSWRSGLISEAHRDNITFTISPSWRYKISSFNIVK
jgi:hypothetical protein